MLSFLHIRCELKCSEIFSSLLRGTVTEMSTINYTAYTDILTVETNRKLLFKKKIKMRVMTTKRSL